MCVRLDNGYVFFLFVCVLLSWPCCILVVDMHVYARMLYGLKDEKGANC